MSLVWMLEMDVVVLSSTMSKPGPDEQRLLPMYGMAMALATPRVCLVSCQEHFGRPVVLVVGR